MLLRYNKDLPPTPIVPATGRITHIFSKFYSNLGRLLVARGCANDVRLRTNEYAELAVSFSLTAPMAYTWLPPAAERGEQEQHAAPPRDIGIVVMSGPAEPQFRQHHGEDTGYEKPG